MGIIKLKTDSKADNTYLNNCIEYVLNGDSIYRNGFNIYLGDAYNQMMKVKEYYRKTSGNQLVHIIVSFNVGISINKAIEYSKRIGAYYSDKYQIIYAIHYKNRETKRGEVSNSLHVHYVMNSVNFVNGKKYADNKSDVYQFVQYIKKVAHDDYWKAIYS